jgi:hypothetical protein
LSARFLLLFLILCTFIGAAAKAVPTSTAAAMPLRLTAWCGGSESWQSAGRKTGRLVRVKARVVSAVYARSSSGRPTFINLGHSYPNPNRLTLLIWGRNRANFPAAPERMFRRGRLVCAQGIVTRYRGVPEIEVAIWDPAARLMSG